jgi:hypothetical protein
MGNTSTVGGKFDTDSDGNIMYNNENPINLPFVKQNEWANGDNYNFLNTKFVPIIENGYLPNVDFSKTLNESSLFTELKNDVSLIGSKYTGMQKTYNDNFSRIASNLGMGYDTSDGVLSGSTNSSTFVTTSTVNSIIDSKFSAAFPDQVLTYVSCYDGACSNLKSPCYYKYAGDTLTMWGNTNIGNDPNPFMLKPGSSYVLHFPKAFANLDYSISITPVVWDDQTIIFPNLIITSKKESNFKIRNIGSGYGHFSWIAIGKMISP